MLHSIAAAYHNKAAPHPDITVGFQDMPVVPQAKAAASYKIAAPRHHRAAGPQNNSAVLHEMIIQLVIEHIGCLLLYH